MNDAPRQRRPGAWLAAALLFILSSGPTLASPPACRVAFDLGSSGIRIGSSQTPRSERTPLDALALQKTAAGIDALLGPTVVALRDLQRGLRQTSTTAPGACVQLGGGFSAWRLAADTNRQRLAELLGLIEHVTGVGILVIPQAQEGIYAYVGTRQVLDEGRATRLAASHILDIGGGSLQIADASGARGVALGQKTWYAQLCQTLRQQTAEHCRLQPLTTAELALARRQLQGQLSPLSKLSEPDSAHRPAVHRLMAISRPVTQGVKPALDRLFPANPATPRLQEADLGRAIAQIASLDADATAKQLAAAPAHAKYLISDLLLVEGVLHVTGLDHLHVEKIEVTNVPGLLGDKRAAAWRQDYPCYLERLRTQGSTAYESDPQTCRQEAPAMGPQ